MKSTKKAFPARKGFLIAALVWLSACIIGAVPYLISGTYDNFIDAFFEAASGFTTTGATCIEDLSAVPGIVLFWRSLTHWLGGMGIVVLFAAFFPSWGIHGQLAAYAETPGPSKGKFTARFSDTAKDLYKIYLTITIVLFIILKLLDMSWLDSITTAFSTLATGGFANYNNNAEGFSIPVKIVLILFMYIAGINFNLLYGVKKHGIKILARDQEFRFYTAIMTVGALLIFCANSFLMSRRGFGYNLLDSFFHVVFFVGGCASSTGGGIKVSRIIICLKLIRRYFSMRIHPNRISKITMNNMEISTDIAIKTTGFIFTYIAVLIIGTLIISLNGLGFITSFSCAASCLANVGPGFGLIGPAFNFTALSQFSRLICSFLMIIGRLELYTIIVLFSRHYWNPDRG